MSEENEQQAQLNELHQSYSAGCATFGDRIYRAINVLVETWQEGKIVFFQLQEINKKAHEINTQSKEPSPTPPSDLKP